VTRQDTSCHHAVDAAGAGSGWADGVIRAAAGVTVVRLAGVAGAISYSHMRELAAAHGEAGWQAHTFPLSVDGIEIVASLVLLADKRAARSSGRLPWAALVAGTAASLAANVAAAHADVIGRVVAGWPAFALLVAVKLCSRLLEPRPGGDARPAAADGRRVGVAARPRLGDGTGDGPYGRDAAGDDVTRAGTRPAARDGGRAAPAPDGAGPGDGAGTAPSRARPVLAGDGDVVGLLPAARVARDRVVARDGTLTRDGLAAQLRRDGHAVRNATVSELLTALRHEPASRDAQPA
jgi:hypothetical protein